MGIVHIPTGRNYLKNCWVAIDLDSLILFSVEYSGTIERNIHSKSTGPKSSK